MTSFVDEVETKIIGLINLIFRRNNIIIDNNKNQINFQILDLHNTFTKINTALTHRTQYR